MPPYVYQHVRNLTGIVDSLTEPPEPTVQDERPPSLGRVVDSYLEAHGYKDSSIFTIVCSYTDAQNVGDFVKSLCSKGMAQREVEWLWDFIVL
jgi:hypothetical protein